MTIQVGSLFAARWEVFWATTYSFELELFDEYLLRRLGEPPLNATVLVDFANLARLYDGIGPGEEWRIQRVNHDYLLRGLALSESGRFHPKTYFFGNEKEGSLLIGSGNLSLRGIDEGFEVFCRFDSEDALGASVFGAWRRWMNQVVEGDKDEELQHRWFRLQRTTSDWLPPAKATSLFVSNLERSIAEQVLAGFGSGIDELHIAAPFFDRKAQALASILSRTKPKRITVYLGSETSVDGKELKAVLDRARATVSVYRFDPAQFVHAKLIGLIKGARGRLLSGSANLSRAALESVVGREPWANVEAGVLLDTDPDRVRSAFMSSSLKLQKANLADLPALDYVEPPESPALPVRLRSARRLDAGIVEVAAADEIPSNARLTTGAHTVGLDGARTKEPVRTSDSGVLVWLVDRSAAPISNRVALDDTLALRKQLEARAGGASDKPRELDAADLDTPVGRILLRLHQEFIFDVEETGVLRHAERAGEAEEDPPTDGAAFWEQLAREELAADPRASAYRREWSHDLLEDDDVLRLLRMMLDRAPEHRLIRPEKRPGEPERPERRPANRWTPTRRLQVRLVNMFRRWSRALADPRMNWLHPFASIRNFQALLYALAELWEVEALPHDKCLLLCGELFGSFIRSDAAEGYLASLNDEQRTDALSKFTDEARSMTAALLYVALRAEEGWEDFIFDWQVWLLPAEDWDLIATTKDTAKLVARLLGRRVPVAEIEDRLRWACEYIDDPHWCRKMRTLCGLKRVHFSSKKVANNFVVEVSDRGIIDHPGIVKLARAALDYRRADSVTIIAGEERLSVRLGDIAAVRFADRTMLETSGPIDIALLAELDEQGLTWRDAFRAEAPRQVS